MWPDYRIQNHFGIELPIIQAPMAGVAFSEIVVGVSEAGGMGSLACALLISLPLGEYELSMSQNVGVDVTSVLVAVKQGPHSSKKIRVVMLNGT